MKDETISNEFLQWFIGFTEGDGSFGLQDGRPVFVINQADLAVLQYIQKNLGCGVLSTFKQNNSVYARYVVKDKASVERLIHLINGNIHLEKVQTRLNRWVKAFDKIYGCSTNLYPRLDPKQLTLNSAWLAGFFDAEGGFYAGLSKNNRMALGFRLRLNAYLDQKNEYDFMTQIASLFLTSSVTKRSGKQDCYRVEIQ